MRKRLSVVFSAVLALAIAAFLIYSRREAFLAKATALIEERLQKNLQCQLSIKQLSPNILSDVAMKDLTMSFTQASGLTFNLKVKEARLDYSLQQLLFSNPQEMMMLRLIGPSLSISYQPQQAEQAPSVEMAAPCLNLAGLELGNLVFLLEDGEISLNGAPAFLKNVQGRMLLQKDSFYFKDIKASLLNNPANSLKVYGEFTKDEVFITAQLEHLQLKDFDIITNVSFTLNKKVPIGEQEELLSGNLKSYGSVLNNRPFPEVNAAFELKESALRILTCTIGEEYDLRGIVTLKPQVLADLSLSLFQAAPHELVAQFLYPERPDFSGLTNGLVKISGPLNALTYDGYLEVTNGHMGELKFVSANINIKGQYPKIYFVDSRFSREEDSLIMNGEIDLTKPENFSLVFGLDQGIYWQGWDINRNYDTVRMTRDIAEDVKVSFDTSIDENSSGYEDVYTNELGVAYKVFGDQALKLRIKKDEGILGIERRIKF
ncbi:MAG: hypothetical protein V1727_05115 [Candidatus Omnitrophota bacterium]